MSRLRLICFDGTWCDRDAKSKATLLASIKDFVIKDTGLEIKYYSEIGSHGGLIEKYIGASLAAREVTSTVIDAISDLATNYRPGDEIVVLAYSRGSCVGCRFIEFLDRVGLPKDGDRHVLQILYDEYTSSRFLKRDAALRLRKKYKCIGVKIKTCTSQPSGIPISLAHEQREQPLALRLTTLLFGALGTLRTGIVHLLGSPFSKRPSYMGANAASNVEVLLHGLALNESRALFQPTIMHVEEASSQILQQVWFPGSHGDIAQDDETGSISDSVLAWCVASLEKHAGITFNEEKLALRFPRKGANCPISDVSSDRFDWVHDPISDPAKGLWWFVGRKPRIPNSWAVAGKRTGECVHLVARLRGYGSNCGTSVVPGYRLKKRGNRVIWKRVRSQSLGDDYNPSCLAEAVLSPREADLLGISMASQREATSQREVTTINELP
ncbi:hypothetical protein PWT90_04642 [Aphanocladium album]|nr:hypothetical protein PWT90_04642 [Aphanocladium album]